MPALPSTLEARPGDGLPQLQQALEQALDIAGGLEVGQAGSPLRDHLLALYKELDTKPLKVVLFGHDEVGREIALQWLGGESLRSLASIPAGTGMVELELVAGGYALITPGDRHIFDRPEELWDAVRSARLLPEGGASTRGDHLHVEIAAPRNWQGVKIWIIDSAAALTQDPARSISVRLATEASLVVAVALVDRGWDEATVQTVCELAAGNITTWVITYGAAASSSPLATPGLSQFLSSRRMSASHVGPGLRSLSAYSGILEQARALVFGSQQCQRFEASLDTIAEYIQKELQQQTSRRNALIRRCEGLGDPRRERGIREQCDATRRSLDDGLNRLNDQLADHFRERMLPMSAPMKRINELLGSLSIGDIAEEASGSIIALSMAKAFSQKVVTLLQEIGREAFARDLDLLRSELESLTKTAASNLTSILNVPFSIRYNQPDEPALWDAFQKSVHFDPQWHSQLPKISVYERAFQGGKRWIAPITAFMAFLFSDKAIYPLPEQLQSLLRRFSAAVLGRRGPGGGSLGSPGSE